MRLKPKFYGPLRLQRNTPGHFTYTTEAGYQASTGAPASAELAPPSDLIMAALASCIGISVEMAAEELNLDPGAIDIVINGAKARDLPHRFGSFEATVHLDDIEDRDIAARLLNQAKQICTVSNTLKAEVAVVLGDKREK